MAEFSKFVHVDLNAGVRNVPVEGGFFRRDALANRLGVIVSKDHEPVTLTGIIKGFVKYPPHDPPATGTDVTIYSFDGTIDPEDLSKAYIDLPAEAYYYNGPITVAIRNDVGDKKTVLATFTGYVSDSTDGTDGIPPHSLPDDINQFISYLSQLETDIANVQTAAAQAARVNITQSKTDHVITVQTTGRTVSEDRTTTITEPTATLSKEQDGPYTLSVTDVTGTTAMTIPDPAAEVKKKVNRSSVTSVKTAYSDDGTVTVDDALDEPAKLTLSLEPKQDLHGYDRPWVGGAGKNLLPMTVDLVKAANSTTTWNGNQCEYLGIVCKLITDASNNLVGITFNGTASQNFDFNLTAIGVAVFSGAKTLIINGCSGGSLATYSLKVRVVNNGTTTQRVSQYNGNDINVILAANESADRIYFNVLSGVTVSNVTIYPMIRLSTETDPTYEPYSNICPITGYDNVTITRTGKNLIHGWEQIGATSKTNLIRVSFETGCCYTFSVNSDTLSVKNIIYYYDENKIYIGRSVGSQEWPKTIYPSSNISVDGHGTLIENGVKYIQFVVYSGVPSPQTAELLDSLFQVELGENSSDYEEPKSKDISIGLLSVTDSTFYGGTVTLNEDGSGTIICNRYGYVFNGTEEWTFNGSNDSKLFRTVTDSNGDHYPGIKNDTSRTTSTDSACSHFNSGYVTTTSTSIGVYYFYRSASYDYPFIQFRPVNFGDYATPADWQQQVADWYNAGTPLQIMYELATPVTYEFTAEQLTTILGTNIVSIDAGKHLELTYRVDKYGKIAEVYSAFPEDSVGPVDMASFTDGANDIPVKSLEVSIEPKQDTHGYDHPWAGGAGKNLLQCNATIREITVNGVAWKINDDGSVTISGTATAESTFRYAENAEQLFNGSYRFRTFPGGIPIADFNGGILIGTKWFAVYADGSNYSINNADGALSQVWFQVRAGKTVNTTLYPIIYDASDTTPVKWSPYSNICPIESYDAVTVTRTGKNLLNITAQSTEINGLTFDVESYGRIIINGTATAQTLINVGTSESLPGYDRVLWGIPEGASTNTYFMTRNGSSGNTYANGYSMTETGVVSPRIYVQAGVTCNNVVFRPAIYIASEMAITTIPVSVIAGSEVYGGTLDVANGKLTVDRRKIRIKDLSTWGGAGAQYYYASIADKKPGLDNFECEAFFKTLESATAMPKGSMKGNVSNTTMYFRNPDYATVDAFLSAFGDYHIVYEVANPQTYLITANQIKTLLGSNAIWSDAGQVSLTYRQSPKLIINDLIRRIEALEAQN